MLRRVPCIPLGEDQCCAECSPSSHPIVDESGENGVSLSARFDQNVVNQAGIALGWRSPSHHPFHCWR